MQPLRRSVPPSSGKDQKKPVSRFHLAFQAPSRDVVHTSHAAILAAGGQDNGAPRERSYHPGYYAALVLDLDRNNIEAVHHDAAQRSAAPVVLKAIGS